MKTLEFRDGSLLLIDQTKLPLGPAIIECTEVEQVAEAIYHLRVRGAPAIGCAAAYGVVIAAQKLVREHVERAAFVAGVEGAIEHLSRTRPTAVNLFWALARMRRLLEAGDAQDPTSVTNRLLREADAMVREDEAANRSMGRHGAELISDGANVLTHCNAGGLATAAYGTALGVIRAAFEQGKQIHVWVDETRPLLQGARLTSWELQEWGIPYTLITDSMAGHFMAAGKIDLAIVGADRIVANGDAANKIGTYSAAVLARAHDIPFYFAAPTSTIDLHTERGADITIEERNPEEVTHVGGRRIAPEGARAANPAFDVTPARLIAAIVTEHGVLRPPFGPGLSHAVEQGRLLLEPVPVVLGAPEP